MCPNEAAEFGGDNPEPITLKVNFKGSKPSHFETHGFGCVFSFTYTLLMKNADDGVQPADALQSVLGDYRQTPLALNTIDELGEVLITKRGFNFDITEIRLRLRGAGAALKDIPEFDPDLRELDSQGERTLEAFRDFHRDKLGGQFTLDRPVLKEIASRVAGGSLLITGDPGHR